MCARAARLPLPCLVAGNALFVFSTTEIHERELKKKYYALRTTWRNSGPKIAHSASHDDRTETRRKTLTYVKYTECGNQKVYERAFAI